eukprot:CAMPEP_0195579576 /NCGR_PEP_ID=MMETSP0814-20130614/15396_1 /TAXON_ID=97485 /ORGANISM="Prymnesium parvum, Strain Texoma1" /LENGTH=30 /DNA_ID= /DNA_START= /DNA_END= /DNA_ORIENTATION=
MSCSIAACVSHRSMYLARQASITSTSPATI